MTGGALEAQSQQEQCLSGAGLVYRVRYVGSIAITTSMRSLNYETRLQVAVECIHRVCEAAKGRVPGERKRKKPDRCVAMAVSEEPNLEHTWENVEMRITSSIVSVTSINSREVLAQHEMPNISFASGGDADTASFVAYVAKDPSLTRTCFVVECGASLALEIINTLGQAFQLRFREVCRRTNSCDEERASSNPFVDAVEEAEYYNDMPGKVPPDLSEVRKGKQRDPQDVAGSSATPVLRTRSNPTQSPLASDLIDLNFESQQQKLLPRLYMNEPLTPSSLRGAATSSKSDAAVPPSPTASFRDPFDMQPFSSQLASAQLGPGAAKRKPPAPPMEQEPWFFGSVSRREAEELVKQDGDFLVRESQGIRGQFVLSGMNEGCRKHLLLVDPEGVVRTKDRTFESVTHLIHYHRDNSLPIISADSEVLLLRPARKPRQV